MQFEKNIFEYIYYLSPMLPITEDTNLMQCIRFISNVKLMTLVQIIQDRKYLLTVYLFFINEVKSTLKIYFLIKLKRKGPGTFQSLSFPSRCYL